MSAEPNDNVHTVDDEAYDPVPTYNEAFPPLPEGESSGSKNGASRTPMLRSSVVTQVFCVPLEERRFRDMSQGFGDDQSNKICMEIMNRTGVAIEMSSAKDQSLTVVLNGKSDAVMKARKEVVQRLQTQARVVINIPKEHHRFILGPKGKRLTELELNTATKITIPRSDENSNEIVVVGAKEGLERARHEIQIISEEQAKLAFERLPIPKCYHPFIFGPNNTILKKMVEETGARINIPPPPVMKDEIVVSGEKDGVHKAVQRINKIYEEKRRKCQTVSVEVRKSQHKYVIGRRGENLQEILERTGVSVEVPPLDTSSETITLRGEQEKLGPALTEVYSKANSVVIAEVDAPAWLHRFIIGPKGVNVRQLTDEHNKVHIEFEVGNDKISVEGPPEQVSAVREELEKITKDLKARMAFVEIAVDQKYHRHIIGRNGANVTRLKKDTGVSIRIPSDQDKSNIIRLEGTPNGVAQAKMELEAMVVKMENERSKDILIEQRFHKTMIGAAGGKIKEIRDKFNQVQITFPDPSKKSDVVTLRGPKNDVDKAHKYMQQMHGELKEQNYQDQVHIFKNFHKNIIGKGGANIRKIRDETETRIDIPSSTNESDAIVITGLKPNVEKAKAKIEQIQRELISIKEVTVEISHKHHNSMIGAKGHLIRSIMNDCGNVLIRFPPEGSPSDKVTIRGPAEDVERARKQLLETASELQECSFSATVRANPDYYRFLIGRGGLNIRKIRDQTGARIVFPSEKDSDQEVVTIMGREDAVKKAKKEIEELIKKLDNVVEGEVSVDPKHHRHFVARRGDILRNISEEFGNVTVSFPRSGVKSDKVIIKGAAECVEGAKARILEIVKDLESQVTIQCVIPQNYHRTVMGARGYKVQEVTRDCDVSIKFPDRPEGKNQKNGNATAEMNGDADPAELDESGDHTRSADVILITGQPDNCNEAAERLKALVPITKDVPVQFDYHRFIIGQKGASVREMMQRYDVNIVVPPHGDQSNTISVTGAPTNVADAEKAIQEKVKELDGEEEDRKLRNHTIEVRVDSKYHPKIIGRKGAVISKIRDQHDVNIQFPDRNKADSDLIIITGYERHGEAAKAAIMAIVNELLSMVTEEVKIDARVHSRLIGSKGRNLRKISEDYNLQDIQEDEDTRQFLAPPSREDSRTVPNRKQEFKVRNAPWSVPDTSSSADFPELGGAARPAPMAVWGPKRK